MDLVYGEDNFIACLPTVLNLKGNNDQFGFSGTHEYTIVYARNKQAIENINGPCGIFDDGGYEDETESIIKRLEVFQYETIIVTEDVAAVLLDRNPNCFAGCPNLQMTDGKDNSHK